MNLMGLVIGGLGVLSECADLDRQCWNAAFRQCGLHWEWHWDLYCDLMRPGGDRQLAARYADMIGMEVDAERLDTVHRNLMAARLSEGIPLRPGIAPLLRWAEQQGLVTGMVSRAHPQPVFALLQATARAREGIALGAVVTRADCARLAPHPDAMNLALGQLGLSAEAAVAIADTPASAAAALDAGMRVLGYPGRMAEEQGFPDGTEVVESLAIDLFIGGDGPRPQRAAQ